MTTNTLTSVIKPRVRGFICVTSHPVGCAAHVREQIEYVKSQPPLTGAAKKVLVIGSSTGYGLASRISSAFAGGAGTFGVYYEKVPEGGKTGTAGWYNTVAFEKEAHKQGLYAKSINGDAFSDQIKQQVVEAIKKDLGKVDLVIYSLASPKRMHPRTQQLLSSCLKPIGKTYSSKTLDTDKGIVKDVTIEPANDAEIEETVAVMGGEDWQMWMEALHKGGVLEDGARTIAYSYIGPQMTWPVYRDGTIGRAKTDLERAVSWIESNCKDKNVRAYVSVNKAVVTQASSAIPVVPLYISLLFKVMKEAGNHEGCIEQIYRLYSEHLFNGHTPKLDEAGRIRIDDLEMSDKVQSKVLALWNSVTTENLNDISDFEGYKCEFLRLFGFGLKGVDYEEPVSADL